MAFSSSSTTSAIRLAKALTSSTVRCSSSAFIPCSIRRTAKLALRRRLSRMQLPINWTKSYSFFAFYLRRAALF
jgi:hypothetical protein